MKVCSKCKVEKPTERFSKNKARKDGLQPYCRDCCKEVSSKYRQENREKLRLSNKKYSKENNEKVKLKNKKWRDDNKERTAPVFKKYYEDNKEKIALRNKKYRNNRGTNLKKLRYKNDIKYKLGVLLRSRINHALKNNQKSGSAVSDLGCSIEEFKKYLESKFQEGMNWHNHGKFGWHIDHQIPVASFDLTDREQFLKAVHYTNLQPLWWYENLSKNGKRELAC
jgi:hypothetical protein